MRNRIKAGALKPLFGNGFSPLHFYTTMEKFKKIEKEFLLSDSSVNSYGFRLLTSGYVLAEFKKNPIGYHMHDRDNGVLVKWDDLQVREDCVYGKPCINLAHPRGQRTVDEVESGFLNAASFGHFVVLDISTRADDVLENQTGPTVTKWFNRECSLVDIPGNYNALTSLFDSEGKAIHLSDFALNKLNNTMKVINVTAAQLAVLTLAADADATAFDVALNALVARAAKADELQTQLAAKTNELADFKKAANAEKIEAVLTAAVAAGKITKELSHMYKVDYADNAPGLMALLDKTPVYKSITAQIDEQADAVKALAAKSYDDLDKSGELPKLKAVAPDVFKTKFKEKHGTDYPG